MECTKELEKFSYKQKNTSQKINKIILGDCTEIIKSLPADMKFDLIIADPPYNIGKDFGNNKDNKELTDYINWSVEWIKLCLNRLEDNGLMYIYGFSEILAYITIHFPLKNQKWLVWHYTNKTIPSLKFWQRSHETIICLWKNKRPDLEIDPIREPYTEAYKKCIGKIRKNSKGRFGSTETIYRGHEKGALPRDVLKISALAGGKGFVQRSSLKHPTQKPFELSEKLLKSRINRQRGKVLIPFSGSGSECVVAKSLGIDFLGIEINPQYVKASRKWLANIKRECKKQ